MRVDLAAASDVATAVAGSKEGSCGAGLGGGGGEGWGDGVGGPKFGGDADCTMEPDTMPSRKRKAACYRTVAGQRDTLGGIIRVVTPYQVCGPGSKPFIVKFIRHCCCFRTVRQPVHTHYVTTECTEQTTMIIYGLRL